MVCCAVGSCKNSSAKSTKHRDGISFHRFPQDKKRRKMWETAVKREAEWLATDSSVVCSHHFDGKDFYYTESGLRRLLTDAVPTIDISLCENKQRKSEFELIGFKQNDSEEVILLKQKVRRLEVISFNRKKQITLMRQTQKRMQKKLDRMRFIIKHLVQTRDKDKGVT